MPLSEQKSDRDHCCQSEGEWIYALLCLQATSKEFVRVCSHYSTKGHGDLPRYKKGDKHSVHGAYEIKEAMFAHDHQCQRTMLATRISLANSMTFAYSFLSLSTGFAIVALNDFRHTTARAMASTMTPGAAYSHH